MIERGDSLIKSSFAQYFADNCKFGTANKFVFIGIVMDTVSSAEKLIDVYWDQVKSPEWLENTATGDFLNQPVLR